MHEPPEAAAALAKYAPEIATQTRAAREYVRSLFPCGYELVYDNYNAFGFGFGTGIKATDVRVSVVAYSRWVTLFFLYGATLNDPGKVLQGSGSRVRSVRLDPPEVLHSPEVAALLEQEVKRSLPAFSAAPPITTIVKAVAERQRPRAPVKKAAVAKDASRVRAKREA